MLAVNGLIHMAEPVEPGLGSGGVDWVMMPLAKKRPEVQAPFTSIVKYNHYTFYNVHALFAILDDLEASRDTYYNALCESKNGRYVMKHHQGIVDINTGETAIDLLRWYAYLEDWPFYIERLKTQFYKGKGAGASNGGSGKGKGTKRGLRVVNRIVLNTRPLSWFGVTINSPARCFHKALNTAREDYKRHKLKPTMLGPPGTLESRVNAVRLSFNTPAYYWMDKSEKQMSLVTIDIGGTTCPSNATLIYSAGATNLSPSTTT